MTSSFLRYYYLAISLAVVITTTTSSPYSRGSSDTVYGRREGAQRQKTVGSTIHFDDGDSQAPENIRSSSFTSSLSSSDDNDPLDDLSQNYSPRYQQNLERFKTHQSTSSYHHSSPSIASTVYGHPETTEDEEPMQWSPSNGQVATFARGSPEDDSFMVQSAPSKGLNWGKSKKPTSVARPKGRITFGPSSSSISVGTSYSIGGRSSLRRSKRSPPMYEQQPYRRSYPSPPYSGGYNNYNQYGGGYKEQEEKCYYHTLVNGDSEVLLKILLPIRLRGRTIVRTCIPPTPDVNDPRYKVLLRGSNQSSFGHLGVSMKL